MDELTESTSTALSGEHQTVVFRLGEESYGIEIFRVNEIIRVREITPIPGTEAHIKGLVNLRGKTIPIVDLRTRLQLPKVEQSETTRIIVVDTEGGNIGVVVDAVTEVITLMDTQIEETPALVCDENTDFVKSLAKQDDRIITLLDLDKALVA